MRPSVEKDPPALQLHDLAFGERNENAVSGLLKGGLTCCDRIRCGIALN